MGLEYAFTFHLSPFTFHVLTSLLFLFFWRLVFKKSYYGGVWGDRLMTLSTATVCKPFAPLRTAQMALSFCTGTGDGFGWCRQTTYDTGYTAVLFDT
jgi:hypothetical protein